jgi:branched-chain amino acid aminotransferase
MELQVTKSTNLKQKPNIDSLVFGENFTDHMFVMTYTEGVGWHDAQIKEYGPVCLSPAALVFHYGQETFEGLKAYRNEEGKISLFRARENFERMNRSNARMCIPAVDVDFMMDVLKTLLNLEKDWIPTKDGTSLYVRPFVFATEASLGVKISKEFLFMIILSPVGSYYAGGMQPTSIYVEDKYVRAMEGGTGEAKCGGNYAVSLKPYAEAKGKGYAQVLFLDGKEKKYVEEIGTSNAFFVIDGVLYTAPLAGTILPGLTRDSIIRIAKDKGYTVKEEKLAIDKIMQAYKDGKLQEAFASGTAAVISPIGKLSYRDQTIEINNNEIGPIAQTLYDELTSIQTGKIADPYGWVIDITE